MAKIKLSDYIAKRLKNKYGVKHFFMVSGGGAMHLNDSLGKYISYTANHHEQACSFCAEGYARINQNLAVVNVTTGPGGLNCLNGLFGQWTDSVPVLYISGQVKTSTTMQSCPNVELRQLGDQEVDIISVVKPLTKYAKTVTKPNKIKYYIDKAIYKATNGRKGPVWLNIPMDIQAAIIDEEELKEFEPKEEKKHDLHIKEVIKKLNQAKRPLIIAGNGIHLSKSEKMFYKLLKHTATPVLTTFNAMDLLPTKHKNFCGRFGTVGQRAGNFALQNADLILFLGTRNNIRQISYNYENFAKNAYKIIVDIDKAELEKPTVKADLKINADLNDFLPELVKTFPKINFSDWLKFCKNIYEKYDFENVEEYKSEEKTINVYDFIHTLTEEMSEKDIMVTANGSACVCTHQVGIVKEGQRIFYNSGDASMGYALPTSIGVYYEAKGRNVICLEGDGSIMMNLQELQTVVHNNLPIKIFVINNNGYSSIRQTQKNFFNGHLTGSGVNSGVSVPDFVKIGKAFGLKSIKIDNPKSMKRKIKSVLSEKTPVLIEVKVQEEYNFIPKLSSKKLDDGTMVSPSLEDMFPFLSREELGKNII